MKNSFFIYLFLFLASIFSRCAENANRVYFSINPNDRKIILPVHLNDSITANLAFDTGWYDTAIFLDSAFVAAHPSLVPNTLPDTSQAGSSWANYSVPNLVYNTSQTAKIGTTKLIYNGLQIFNWKKALQTNDSEGVFNIPKNDTTHVWEWNFENNYLEIHPTENFKMPENCFLFSLEGNGPHYIQFPLQIKCSDGDTLTISRSYLVDMGMPWDIAIKYSAKELKFFNQRDDAVWTRYRDRYFRHYTVNATLFDNFTMDSLRIYTFDYPDGVPSKYLIGQNFLKRFNVFFDLKNHQIGLQPIKKFHRIVNPLARRFYYSAPPTPNGKYIVTILGNYKNNYYKTAGLQIGDEIIAINETHFKDITRKEHDEFYKEDTLILDIIREGKPLKIVVPVDKNEEQGD
jgi:hypothetical protein